MTTATPNNPTLSMFIAIVHENVVHPSPYHRAYHRFLTCWCESEYHEYFFDCLLETFVMYLGGQRKAAAKIFARMLVHKHEAEHLLSLCMERAFRENVTRWERPQVTNDTDLSGFSEPAAPAYGFMVGLREVKLAEDGTVPHVNSYLGGYTHKNGRIVVDASIWVESFDLACMIGRHTCQESIWDCKGSKCIYLD